MSLDGNGTYSPPAPQFPAIPNTIIYADDFNQIILDIAAALSTAIFRDGQAAFTANQSMGGNKLTNLATGANPQDAVNFLQVFTDPVFVATTLQGFKITGSMFQALMTTINLVASGTVTLTGTTLLDMSASGQVKLPANTSIGPISASELATLDGITATTAELNKLHGATLSTAELNILTGALITTAELNRLQGVTSGVQGQLNAKAPLASPALTGVPTAPTAAAGTNTNQIATMAALLAQAFITALPGQAGQTDGSTVITDGAGNASWTPPASQAEMEAGTQSAIRSMSPLRVAQAIAELATGNPTTFTASGQIAAHKAVILATDGTVKQSVIASATVGSPVDLSGANATAMSTCFDPVNNKFVVFYADASDGSKGKAVVGTVSDGAVTFGSAVTFYSGSIPGDACNLSSCYDPVTGQIVVAYCTNASDARLRTCAVSGTTLTFGAEIVPVASGNSSVSVCYDASVNRVLLIYMLSAAGTGRVITVSGTSLVAGAACNLSSTGSAGQITGAAHCANYTTPGTNVYVWNAGGMGWLSFVRIDTATETVSVVTWGSVNTGQGTNTTCYDICWSALRQAAVVLFRQDPSVATSLHVRILSLNGTSITNGAYAQVSGSGFSNYEKFPQIACSPDGEILCVVYSDSATSFYGKVTFSSTFTAAQISFSGVYQFQSSEVAYHSVAYSADGVKVLAGYSILSGLGRAVLATAPRLDKRTNFIGFSQSAVIAGEQLKVQLPFGLDTGQSGLTPGAPYYLNSSDGSSLTTTVNGPKVGLALSATKLLVLGSNTY